MVLLSPTVMCSQFHVYKVTTFYSYVASAPPSTLCTMLSTFRQHPGLGGFQDVAQLIKELVDNSFDARARKIRVEFAKISDSGQLRLTVSDNGCGMRDIPSSLRMFHSQKSTNTNTQSTTGRYGIGLTLCLLHAQRLSQGSLSVVTSATNDCKKFTTYKVYVDTEKDECRFLEESTTDKHTPNESGTSIGIVLPERLVQAAWPRLAEWFARFVFSHGDTTLEVRAPTLSQIPLQIKPSSDLSTNARHYLGATPLHVVSSSTQRLRLEHMIHNSPQVPTLTCRLCVTGDQGDRHCQLAVLRFCNRTPLLDNDESGACSVLKHLKTKRIFGSFGLRLEHHHDAVFLVHDAEAVQTFLQQGKAVHAPLQQDKHILPAHLRLGTLLLLVDLEARPDVLPLTTLAKGCLPSDPILQQALERALTECLKKLQQVPGLLLTSSQLRQAELDTRYVPAASAAMAAVLSRCGHGNLSALASGLEANFRTIFDQQIQAKAKAQKKKRKADHDESQWPEEEALFVELPSQSQSVLPDDEDTDEDDLFLVRTGLVTPSTASAEKKRPSSPDVNLNDDDWW